MFFLRSLPPPFFFFFFFNDTATTEIYTLSLHDALPISIFGEKDSHAVYFLQQQGIARLDGVNRSEEHTSELQSRLHLVCRLLLEKKKKTDKNQPTQTRPETQRRSLNRNQ